jgi:hypothetical protein
VRTPALRRVAARRVTAHTLLPKIDHLEADDFAARLRACALRLTSIGSENAYAVDSHGAQFYAKDVPEADLTAARALVERFAVEAGTTDPVSRNGFVRDAIVERLVTSKKTEAIEAVRRMHRSGYWVEVFDNVTHELLAGPFDPDQRAPNYIF